MPIKLITYKYYNSSLRLEPITECIVFYFHEGNIFNKTCLLVVLFIYLDGL